MSIPLAYPYAFFLLFVRTLAFFGTAPLFSQRNIPAQAKVGLAGLIGFLLAPAAVDMPLPASDYAFFTAIGQEVALGLLLGFAAMLPLLAIAVVGRLIASAMGMSYSTSISPLLSESAPPLSQFYLQLAVVLFFAIKADHVVLLGLRRMVELMPPGRLLVDVMNVSGEMLVDRFIHFTAQLWAVSLQIALPVIGVILLSDLALVLISKAMPRMNVFSQSLPLKVAMGLVTVFLSLPFFWSEVLQQVDLAGYQMLLLFR